MVKVTARLVGAPGGGLGNHFFNVHGPSDTPLSRVVHGGRLRYLLDVLKQLEKLEKKDGADITADEIADALNALVTGGAPQVYIAKKLNTSKATVNRWRNKETPPRTYALKMIIQTSIEILKELIDSSQTEVA